MLLLNEEEFNEAISAKFYYGPFFQMMNPKKWGYTPIYNGNFEGSRNSILAKVNWCKNKDDIKYLKKDVSTGKTYLKKIASILQDALDNPDDNRQQYREMRKRNKRGLTVEKIENHIKWIDEVYIPAIKEKEKEIK